MIICLLDEVIFFQVNLYLAALGLHCCALAFFICGEQGLLFSVVCRLLIAVYRLLLMVVSLIVEHSLSVHGFQWLQHVGSVVVTHRLQSVGSGDMVCGLSCSVASGIFLDQGLNLCPLHWQTASYQLCHLGSLLILLSL